MANFVKNRYGILINADKLPVLLAGIISTTTTKGRPSPPSPFSGFACENSPYAKGHIMALELGGPDIAENIVPQFGLWQGVGEWRKMEDRVGKNGDGELFTVCLEYEFTETKRSAFDVDWESGMGEVTAWKLREIPSVLHVRVLKAKAADKIVTDLVDLLGRTSFSDADWTTWRGQLGKAAFGVGTLLHEEKFEQKGIPEIDADYWLGKQAIEEIKILEEEHKALQKNPNAKKLAKEEMKIFSDPVTMVAGSAAALRKRLLNRRTKKTKKPIWGNAFLLKKVNGHFAVTARMQVPKQRLAQALGERKTFKELVKKYALEFS